MLTRSQRSLALALCAAFGVAAPAIAHHPGDAAATVSDAVSAPAITLTGTVEALTVVDRVGGKTQSYPILRLQRKEGRAARRRHAGHRGRHPGRRDRQPDRNAVCRQQRRDAGPIQGCPRAACGAGAGQRQVHGRPRRRLRGRDQPVHLSGVRRERWHPRPRDAVPARFAGDGRAGRRRRPRRGRWRRHRPRHHHDPVPPRRQRAAGRDELPRPAGQVPDQRRGAMDL